MLFNSPEFIIFFILFLSFWYFAKRRDSFRWAYLVVFSFIFYGWWDWRFLFLLVFSGLVDYFAALGMEKWPNLRGKLLILSILGNLGSLFIFKYSAFVAGLIDSLIGNFGIIVNLSSNVPEFTLILPVGISFYTFQSMSYTIDVFKRKLKPTRNLLHFFSYLSMFPQLVAGPIVRATKLLPQLKKEPVTDESQRWSGLRMMVGGFFKKMVIADNLAPAVTIAFSGDTVFQDMSFWWIIIIAFALQIYFDFSGYSDIAIGIGRFLGYDFGVNFNYPYVSRSLKEFWQRWHISLSTWFRDYVYIPLGGNRKGRRKAIIFMAIAMILSAVWHGAAITFVIWGLIHAGFLALERISGWTKYIDKISFGSLIAWTFVMLQVLVGWVFFRAESVGQAFSILTRMFSFNNSFEWIGTTDVLWFVVLGMVYEIGSIYFLRREKPLWWRSRTLQVLSVAVAIFVIIFFRGIPADFIYFQF